MARGAARHAPRPVAHRSSRNGKVHGERRALTHLARHVDMTAQLRDHPVHARESEAGPSPLTLGREVGLEDLLASLLVHAVARVGEYEAQVAPWAHSRVLADEAFVPRYLR